MTTINPIERLSVSLEAQQWNQILAQLTQGPYHIVAPLIQVMHDQLNAPRHPDNVVPLEAGS